MSGPSGRARLARLRCGADAAANTIQALALESVAKPVTRVRRLAAHAALLACFAALAVWFTWPLAARLSKPVTAYGDGAVFLWDLWWFRHALVDLHTNPFVTHHQFHSVGIPLYLHTLTPARGLAALPLIPLVGLEATNHLLYLASFVLAAWGMFLLARDWGLRSLPSVFAGIAFSFSQYHVARGYGLFNLTEIQWFPFYLLFLRRGLAKGSRRDLLCAAFFLLVIAYSDYYYWCYAFLLTALYLACLHGGAVLSRIRAFLGGGGLERIVSVALVAAALVWLFVVAAGGVRMRVGPFVVSLTSSHRALGALLALGALKAYLRFRRSRAGGLAAGEEWRWGATWSAVRPLVSVLLWIGLPFLLGFAPVLVGLLRYAGEYRGTLAYDETFSRAFAANVQSLVISGTFRPDGVIARWWEPSAHFLQSGLGFYLGLVPTALALAGAFLTRASSFSRFLMATALLFLNLSLGPVLYVGQEVYLDHSPVRALLLYNALKDVPILGACRAPARFVVMTLFCQALLAGAALDWIERRGRAASRASRVVAAGGLTLLAMLALVLELHPGRFHCRRLGVPAYYRALHDQGGTLLDLPLSWASGQRCLGSWKSDQFYFQTVHGLPLFSGQVSRVPDSVFARLQAQPLLGPIMRLQSGRSKGARPSADEIQAARAFVADQQIRQVVLHWDDPDVDADRMELVRAYLEACVDLQEVYRDPNVVVWRVSMPELPPQLPRS